MCPPVCVINLLLWYCRYIHSYSCSMDDLASKGAEFVAIVEPYPLVKVTSVMRSFARLHAHFWERVSE